MEPSVEKDSSVTRAEVDELEETVQENKRLLEENNRLLKKINRSNTWAFWLRLLWMAVLLGAPFLLYYYLLAPYYESLDSAFKYFGVELPDIPNWGSDNVE